MEGKISADRWFSQAGEEHEGSSTPRVTRFTILMLRSGVTSEGMAETTRVNPARPRTCYTRLGT